MTKTDTSREAVERYLDARGKHLGTTSDQERIHSVGLPNCGIVTLTTTDIRALLTERDALQARAERAEAALEPFAQLAKHHAADAPEWGPFDSVSAQVSIMSLRESMAILAQLDAEPAGVSEPAGVKVKPGKLERIVWSAMVWARENPGPDEVPEYTDGGNSFAETECRATVARILAALESGQTHREGWEQAKEAAAKVCTGDTERPPKIPAKKLRRMSVQDQFAYEQERLAWKDADEIRAMPYPGDSQ